MRDACDIRQRIGFALFWRTNRLRLNFIKLARIHLGKLPQNFPPYRSDSVAKTAIDKAKIGTLFER